MSFEPRWENPADAGYGWRRGGRPYPLTKLYEDVMRAILAGMRTCFAETGSPMAREHIATFMDGWAFVRAPKVDEAEVEQRMQRHADHAQRYEARGGHYYLDELRPEVVSTIKKLSRHPPLTRSLDVLVDHLEEAINAEGHIMGDLHWRMAGALVRGTPFDWPTVYHEITGRPATEASVFVGGLDNEMTKAIRGLQRLARLAQEDPELLKAVEARDVSALDRDDPAFRRFRTAFRRLLRTYGARAGHGWGSAVSLEAPTWNMRPDIPLGMIATYARSDLDALARKEKDAAAKRRTLAREVRRQLAADREKLERFEAALVRARTMARVIEDHNHWMDQSAPGVMREAADVVGQRLVRDGVIDDPDDVLHLSLDELRAIARSEEIDARALVAERRAAHEERKANPPPESIGAGGEPSSFMEHVKRLTAEGEGLVGRTLRGVAASGGRYTGRARVCAASPIPPDVEDGDILVAEDAGPSWTPVFALLGAMVLDRGATFQHAAVMAREFGIPAVLGTKEGTSTIADGQTISVDGDAGIVELL